MNFKPLLLKYYGGTAIDKLPIQGVLTFKVETNSGKSKYETHEAVGEVNEVD